MAEPEQKGGGMDEEGEENEGREEEKAARGMDPDEAITGNGLNQEDT